MGNEKNQPLPRKSALVSALSCSVFSCNHTDLTVKVEQDGRHANFLEELEEHWTDSASVNLMPMAMAQAQGQQLRANNRQRDI